MNLREICKERLLSDMVRSVVPGVGSGWKVLIVDHLSMRIISAACKMYDVMEENVTGMLLSLCYNVSNTNDVLVVENIALNRQPLPNMEAIYFISPRPESVDALINDFKKNDKLMYSCAHLFFTSSKLYILITLRK
jgi:hypothetical protein